MVKRKRSRVNNEGTTVSSDTGEEYIPGLTVKDVPSHGRSTRTTHSKTPWVAHLLSDIETKYRYLLEWSDVVEKIREQFPLELTATLKIAEDIGVRHPMKPGTKEPVVMTSDFVITTKDGRTIVSTVKPYNRITIRDVEKFEIERLYWVQRGAIWGIVTDKEIPQTLVDNIRYVRKAYNLADLEGR
ncbi:MAG: Tn7 transposase TnsA N-terminal domain-containing protein [Alicyclobacillaceae bacterium]|nr:Tn7 transposase TnsA N-terminal domain-containing protein [Alicyclobacillaceae bacterium]